MKHPATLAAWFLVTTAWATTLPKVPVEILFAEADFVGVVEVVASRTLGAKGESCGAIYTGQIIETFKGAPEEIVEFGHFFGSQTGMRYLVFLTRPGLEYRPLTSTNSMSEGARDEYFASCHDKLTGWNVMHSGYGAIELDWAEPFGYADAFAVSTRYVAFPEAILSKDDDFGSKRKFDAVKWLAEDQVQAYLRQLSK